MSFKQTLIHRIFNANHKLSNQTLRNCRISSATTAVTPSPSAVPEFFRSSILDKLNEMKANNNRIRLDGIVPPVVRRSEGELTVADARKILRVSQIEKVKSLLKSSYHKDCVSYDEFVEICVSGCLNRDQGLDVAKALDDSGSVIVLGDVVFLKPHQGNKIFVLQVVKAIHCLLPMNMPVTQYAPVKELEEMEQWKAAIDTKAKRMVQRELWGGLAYLVVQTAGFMRLTFWELSWDVMEPICFYVTSMYFMGGYAFFLRTAKEPSFEGFYQSRFSLKQKKLMKSQGFDVEKYKELRKACYPDHEEWPSESSSTIEEAKKSIA